METVRIRANGFVKLRPLKKQFGYALTVLLCRVIAQGDVI